MLIAPVTASLRPEDESIREERPNHLPRGERPQFRVIDGHVWLHGHRDARSLEDLDVVTRTGRQRNPIFKQLVHDHLMGSTHCTFASIVSGNLPLVKSGKLRHAASRLSAISSSFRTVFQFLPVQGVCRILSITAHATFGRAMPLG